jgi:1,4-dihydroxy-2-naphthoate octaprenyltransferase
LTPASRFATWIAATRPAFFTASVLPVLVGLAFAWRAGATFHPRLALLTVINIMVIHAGANVLNDYFDALNGTDAANPHRQYPFTGGSRFIQNGALSVEATGRFGAGLMIAGAALGAFMVVQAGPWLLAIGLLGALLGIVYSAPPCLACRGLGDLAIGLAFGVLPVVGTVYIQLGTLEPGAAWLGAVIGFFVSAILWINSIPDIKADAKAGKNTLPVRLGSERARWGLPFLFLAGFVTLAVAPVPAACRLALAAVFPAAAAVLNLYRGRIVTAIPLTLITHAIVCLLLVLACLSGW